MQPALFARVMPCVSIPCRRRRWGCILHQSTSEGIGDGVRSSEGEDTDDTTFSKCAYSTYEDIRSLACG